MTDTLRNQLLGLGFKSTEPKPAPAKTNGHPQRSGRPGRGAQPQGQPDRRGSGGRHPAAGKGPASGARKPGVAGAGQRKGGARDDIDLAKAYAIRSQREKEERIRAEQAKQDEARQRREARARLAELVKDKGLNVANADIARHFPYGGKIKRIHVTAEQLKALNAGELGVLQMDGRYLLVTAEVLAQAEQVFAPAVALKVDPAAPVADDVYADPKYQVPDDLVW